MHIRHILPLIDNLLSTWPRTISLHLKNGQREVQVMSYQGYLSTVQLRFIITITIECKNFKLYDESLAMIKKKHYLSSHILYFLISPGFLNRKRKSDFRPFVALVWTSQHWQNRKNQILVASSCLHNQGNVRSSSQQSSAVKDQTFLAKLDLHRIALIVARLNSLHYLQNIFWKIATRFLKKGKVCDRNVVNNDHLHISDKRNIPAIKHKVTQTFKLFSEPQANEKLLPFCTFVTFLLCVKVIGDAKNTLPLVHLHTALLLKELLTRKWDEKLLISLPCLKLPTEHIAAN